MILSIFVGTAQAAEIPFDVTDKSLIKALNVLVPLNVVKGYPDGEFKPQNNVTRAEFASMLMRIILDDELVEMYKTSDIEFTDLPKDHWAYSAVKAAAAMGAVSGMGDGTFNPEGELLPEHATKMVSCILGYKPMAEEMGGYPKGYNQTATQIGLLRHLSFIPGKPANREFAAKILYNALYTDICELQYDGSYEIKKGETLLSKKLKYLDLTEGKGIVTANSYSSFNEANYENENYISVNNHSYISGEMNIDNLLGYSVSYYVDENDVIYSMIKDDIKNQEMTIGYKSDITLDGKKLKYRDEETKKEKYVILDDNVIVMNNFERISNPVKSDFEIKSGKIKLIDNNDDDKYDVVFIIQYTTYMIDSVDAENETIKLKAFSDKGASTFKGKNVISSTDYRMDIYDADGNKTEIKDLKHNQIICIYSNQKNNYLKAVVTDKVIEGKVQSIHLSDNYVVINDERYDWASDLVSLSITDEGKFWLDIDNRVTAKSIADDSEYKESVNGNSYGYVKSFYEDEDLSNFYVKMLVYMQDGKIKEEKLTLNEKLTVNGQRAYAQDVLDILKKDVPVRYSVNSKGNINEIDNLEVADVPGYRKYNQSLNSFDRMYSLDDAIVHVIAAENEKDIYTANDYKLKDGNYYVEMYKYDDGENTDRIFIVYASMKKYSSMNLPTGENVALIEESYDGIDDDGENVRTVSAYINDKKEEIIIYPENKAYDVFENLKSGSIVLLDVNEQGVIENARMVFDGKAGKHFRLGVGGKHEKIFGTAALTRTNADRTSSIIKVKCNNKTIGYDVSQASIYDVSGRVFEKVDIDTINTLEHSSEPTDVFILSVNYKPVMVLIW